MKDNYYVVFDGTSAFVVDLESITNDLEVIKKFSNETKANDFCEKENEKITR